MLPRHLLRTTALFSLVILGLSTAATAQAQAAQTQGAAGLAATLSQTSAAAAPAVPTDSISYVAGSQSSALRAAPSVTVPRPVQAGDTMLLTASLADVTTAKGPTGWTLVGDRTAASLRSLVWSRTATAADAGRSVTVTLDAARKAALTLTAYRGADAAAPVTARSSADTNTTRHVTPALTVPIGDRVVSYWADKGTSTVKWTTPSGVNLRAAAYSTGSGRVSAAVADFAEARSGAVGGVTATTGAVSARALNWAITLPAKNLPPVAEFGQTCVDLKCDFDASATSDPDGTVAGYAWNFGDDGTANGMLASHTFTTAGTYDVRLTTTDEDGATAQKVVSVTVKVTRPASLFGFWAGSDNVGSGEGARANYDRVSSYLGTPDVYRMFFPGSPGTDFVGSNADFGPPVVVSFKFSPQEVVTGKHDATMTAWFNSIPSTRQVWWSYFHEPENDIEAGAFTAAQYRAAWDHLTALAPKRTNLHPTLILMRYTLSIPTKRTVADYVGQGLEVLCWDSYLTGGLTMKQIITDPAAVSASFGLDYAIGEISAKDPARIDQFVKDLIPAANAAGAKFVTWFETDKSGLGVNEADWRMRPHLAAVATWNE